MHGNRVCKSQYKDVSAEQRAPHKYTFSGIGVYRKALFDGLSQASQRLAPVLVDAMAKNQVSGSLHQGVWVDIGTPERLTQLNAQR